MAVFAVAVFAVAGIAGPGSAAASPGEPLAPVTCPPDAALTPEDQGGPLSPVLRPDVVGDQGQPSPIWIPDGGRTSPGRTSHPPLPVWLADAGRTSPDPTAQQPPPEWLPDPGPISPGDRAGGAPAGCPPSGSALIANDPSALDTLSAGMISDSVPIDNGERQGIGTVGLDDAAGSPEPAEVPDASLPPPGADDVATTLIRGQQGEPPSVGDSMPADTMPRAVEAPEVTLAGAGVLTAEQDQPDPDEVNSLIDQIESQLGTGGPAGGVTGSGASGQGQPRAAPGVAGGQRESGVTASPVQPAGGGSVPAAGASPRLPSGSSAASIQAGGSAAAVDGAGGALAQTGLRLRELLMAAAMCIGSGRVVMALSRPSPPLRK